MLSATAELDSIPLAERKQMASPEKKTMASFVYRNPDGSSDPVVVSELREFHQPGHITPGRWVIRPVVPTRPGPQAFRGPFIMAACSSVPLLLRRSLFAGDPAPLTGFWALTTRGPRGQETERRNRPALIPPVPGVLIPMDLADVPPMNLACTYRTGPAVPPPP